MGNVLINEDYMKGIADAIRTKKSSTDKILAQNMEQEILSIPSGGSATITVGNFSANFYDASTAIVNTYIDANNGELLPYANWTSSDFIKIPYGANGVLITTTGQYNGIYDSNKQYITGFTGGAQVIKLPQNAQFIRCSQTDSRMLTLFVCFLNVDIPPQSSLLVTSESEEF